jgi:IS1 family transposase
MSIDPRLIFFERAAAKLYLVEACYQDLDTAFADLVPAFRQIAVPPCQCERKILASIERHHRKQRREWLRARRRS